MATRLLVVRDAFVAKGREVVVSPKITLDRPAHGAFGVSLRRPDGTERTTTASLDVAHIRGPSAPFAMIRLLDAALDDVPAGTEIWSVD